jgi:hypothetical protein
VAARSKAVCGRLVAGVAGSNTARGMDVCLLCLYVVLSCAGRGLCDGLITRPEESYRVCVWSRNPERETKGPSWTISACDWMRESIRLFCESYENHKYLSPWLKNPEVHHRIHSSSPPVFIPSQSNPIHIPQPVSLRSILIQPSHLIRGLPSGLFPSGFPTKTLHTFLCAWES